jgi:hypothetical protein
MSNYVEKAEKLVSDLQKKNMDDIDIMIEISKKYGNRLNSKELEQISNKILK